MPKYNFICKWVDKETGESGDGPSERQTAVLARVLQKVYDRYARQGELDSDERRKPG